ncbi:rho GTPase-activating protein REN1 isoform X2 [Punica granatum]|uniref:Rho GTPase-activating protein REN1 isoform X2 n=1 Tax=Punica granatum TaxID=22663 RepID=A0A6P8DAM7_PUNGR|nr:rho GTPase-activating protein REN1 isoform X2 [Punica granatum]
MAARSNEPSQGDGSIPPPPPGPGPGPPDHQASSRAGNKVFKSGPLFLSSKGIGWTSWKKRWFILTGTSLVFFRSDPSAIPQKGSEVNLTLGGIDLNNSGSVVVKADKKLLTVAFADGRDGRAFTLKAETLEDLYEWKTALENALAQAPSATLVMGQNGIFRNDQAAPVDGSTEQLKDKQPMKSMVIGRPILLALEEVDGTPSFLEKALRFMEEYGIKVEGILRQAADVDDVENRVREYEQGKTEFSPEEDPHVVADCIKYILREMPSSPVPASCCNALLEACRVDREHRVNAMRTAICETFPEPNRCLLQRILVMMQTVASHKAENRMSSSAVAACMAPLLLRPLLAGDCELENDFDVGGDGSMQLLQAAAAANHAQAIVVTLLEEYDKIFGEGSMSPELYSETEDSGSESEEATDDDESYEDEDPDDGSQYSEIYTDDETENVSSRSNSRSYDDEGSTHTGKTDGDGSTSGSHHSSVAVDHFKENDELSPSAHQTSLLQRDQSQKTNNLASHQGSRSLEEQKNNEPTETLGDTPATSQVQNSAATSSMSKSTTIASGQIPSSRRPAVWGRTPAKKNLSMESIDIFLDDEAEIQKLENAKEDLRNRITEEAKENAVLRANLENQKIAVHERRQVLEQEVARLQEQLQKEKDLRRALEAGLKEPRGPIPCSANIDEKADLEDLAKTQTDINNLKQKVDDLGGQLNRQRDENQASIRDPGNQPQQCGDDHGKVMSKTDETKTADTPCPAERSNSSKRSNSDGTQTEKKRMDQPSTQQQQLDSVGSVKSRNIDQSANSSAADSGSGKPFPPLSSKKSGARGEGTNSTASALSKLTNRLNFLKERRTQITKELQSTDKSQNLDKGRSADMSTGSGSSNQEDKRGTEDTPSNPDKSRNPDTQEELNRGRASDQGQADRTLELSIPSRTDSRSS